ncbi:hypothetical protein RJP21_23835 [Paenibacillus sp. VCA1]|uniref:hypothetical protein n=1 Tax=Paenibacillus sp. VCA1 TaxID=3039148 RepID=UPI0028719798|nr:hypothetical protein [Paenibacillus sp. VCA1]MDR9856638.1 hypothetical protein [Paenibacillus sp. VCA1]
MNRVIYQAPNGSEIVLHDLLELKTHVVEEFPDYWHEGHGGGIISWYDDERCTRQLLILPNDDYRVYLQYIDKRKNEKSYETWLSLQDSENLGEETAEYSDELYASIGLFLPVEKAWLAIEEFCETGERTDKIEWIEDTEMPEDSQF